MKFKIGDRVRSRCDVGTTGGEGSVGTVRCFNGTNLNYAYVQVGVEFDQHIGGHSLGHSSHPHYTSQAGHGWYLYEEGLELIHAAPSVKAYDMAWHCFCDQLSRTPSRREHQAFKAGYEAGRGGE